MNLQTFDHDGFRSWLQLHRKSDLTIRQYLHEVGRFLLWTNEHKAEFERFDQYCLNRYLNWLKAPDAPDPRWKRPISDSSYNVTMSACKNYLRYMGKVEGLADLKLIPLSDNPVGENATRWDEVKRLLDVCSKHDGEMPLMSEFIIRMLYKSGIRIGELLSIRMTDVDWDGTTLKVKITKKGRREDWRTIDWKAPPFTEADVSCFRRYKRMRLAKDETCPYLLCYGHRRPTSVTVRKWLEKWAKAAGLERFPNPHSFRHGHAMDMIESGVHTMTLTGEMHWADEDEARRYNKMPDGEIQKRLPRLGKEEGKK